jgi:phosphoglycolate phosphatase-like HAD superfamily hydrolase
VAKRAIVFDFDGTIADSEKLILDIYDDFAKKSGWPKLTNKRYRILKGSTPQEAMQWAGVRMWQLPRLVRTGRKEYKKHIDDIKLFPYMARTVKKAADMGYDVYVLSSNSKDTVKAVLLANDINGKVKILKGSSLFGKHKILKKIIRKNRYDPASSWMVGDEIRDMVAAKRAGLKSIGVTWGLQSKNGLMKASPAAIAEKPGDILRHVKPTEKKLVSKNG